MLEVILVMCKKVTPVINNCWLQGCVVLDVQNEYVVFEWWSLVLESIAGILVVALQQYQSFSFLPYSSCCYRFLKPNFGTHGLYYSVEWEPDDNHGTLNRLCHTNTYTHIQLPICGFFSFTQYFAKYIYCKSDFRYQMLEQQKTTYNFHWQSNCHSDMKVVKTGIKL